MTEERVRHWVAHWCQLRPEHSHLAAVAHGLRPLLAELDELRPMVVRLKARVEGLERRHVAPGIAGVAVVDDPEADLSRLADDGGPHAGEG